MAEWGLLQTNRIEANWNAPPGIRAFCTTRLGGVSAEPWSGLNLGGHVGDDADAVRENRRLLIESSPGLYAVQWLDQVHGREVHQFSEVVAQPPRADAAITLRSGAACAVLTADCLPVLLCDEAGKEVAAAHAGWRGLLGGVLRATLSTFSAHPGNLMAWLGPCIRQPNFQVGAEVREAYLAEFSGPETGAVDRCFLPDIEPGKYRCDLAGLAHLQLKSLGVRTIADSKLCTVDDPRFYSYRRANPCGRFASLIYRQP